MKTYTVAPGDNLAKVSRKVYGSPEYASYIYHHNLDLIADPNQLTPLMGIRIPALNMDQAAEHLKREIFNA